MKTIITLFTCISLTLFHMNSYSQFTQATHPENGSNMLIGDLTIDNLINEDGFEALTLEEPMEAEAMSLDKLSKQLHNVEIIAFIGTWCSDSQYHFPNVVQLLKTINYPLDKMKIIGLDDKKAGKNGIEKQYDILYVPTIIFLRDNKEIGRMVEQPNVDLVTDFLELTK